VPGWRQFQGSRVASWVERTSPLTIRSSTSVSQACGLMPFSEVVPGSRTGG
jgi:hypothetical protein